MASAPHDGEETDWPLRTWVLAIVGALFALAMRQLSDLPDRGWEWGARMVAAGIVFLGAGGLAFGLAWLRERLFAGIAIALICGVVAGNVLLWQGAPDGLAHGSDGWRLVCGIVASGAILTLFQAAQHRDAGWPAGWSPSGLAAWKREAIHYADVHGHLWTNALTIGLSGLFALLSFGIAHLMAEMFWLVKLGFLRDLLRKDWFDALLIGAAFGAAMGLLRDRGTIISLLQRVAMIVLRVLAPVVALGIFIFLIALPFTGLEPLWDTGGTTPIMLVGAMLALFLCNAVVSDTAQDESRSTVMSSSAAALGLFLVPMVGIAAFSSGLRIQQHGLSPDRLWALTFIIVASITAIAYAIAILATRGWFARLRRTNLHLVFLLGAISLLLSTPLLSFERIATAHQLARLAGGQVSPEDFDYKGLWFDFGPPGREAVRRLAKSAADARIRRFAADVQKVENRWEEAPNETARDSGDALARRLTILPRPVPLDEALRRRLVAFDACGNGEAACTLHFVPEQDYALVIREPDAGCAQCRPQIALLKRDKDGWSNERGYLGADDEAVAMVAAIRAGQVEMRIVERRQIFIGGKPYGDNLPLAVGPLPADAPKPPPERDSD